MINVTLVSKQYYECTRIAQLLNSSKVFSMKNPYWLTFDFTLAIFPIRQLPYKNIGLYSIFLTSIERIEFELKFKIAHVNFPACIKNHHDFLKIFCH